MTRDFLPAKLAYPPSHIPALVALHAGPIGHAAAMRLHLFFSALPAILAFASVLPVVAQAQPGAASSVVKGIVINVEGAWEVNGKQLKLGDTITPGEQATGSNGTLTIWFQEEPPIVYPCSTQCKILLESKRVEPAKKPQKLTAGSIAGFFDSERDQLVVAASRGLEPELREAVLRLRDGQVDAGAAFHEMDPGSYQVSIQPALNPERSFRTQAVRYTSGAPVMVSASGLNPGLYSLDIVDPSGQAIITQAWVLIDGPVQYPQDSDAFNQLVEKMNRWPSEVDPSAPRAIQRAYLQLLAAHENGRESKQ